jgi:hypothetical protein
MSGENFFSYMLAAVDVNLSAVEIYFSFADIDQRVALQ